MLSWFEHEKSFLTSGPSLLLKGEYLVLGELSGSFKIKSHLEGK